MNDGSEARKGTYTGLFLTTLATLMYEILLTRIFSVTMWYHFAFMAISIAMFGMTAGAILVYFFPSHFTTEEVNHHLGRYSLWFGVAILISFLVDLVIPLFVQRPILYVSLTYLVTSIPFVFSGIVVSLALTKFPKQISRLYAVDLAGAALGCVLFIYALKITDGPSAVIGLAFLAALGSVSFLVHEDPGKMKKTAAATCLLFAGLTVANTVLMKQRVPALRLTWAKGADESRLLYERWNSFSRIRISYAPHPMPFGWGLSSVHSYKPLEAGELRLMIDSAALTVLSHFDGNLNELEYLKYDVTNLAHYLREGSQVLVIGVGGGRDILSSLVFQQKRVVGVEINENILHALNEDFGDFTGHLDRIPNVLLVHDEGRTYLARRNDQFDIIQASLIDTWAATSAGAFALSENSLYTLEAWKLFLDRLKPNGILTFSRWCFGDKPLEIYRLTSLATGALLQMGAKDPRSHIVIVKNSSIGTLLLCKAPFTEEELMTIEQVANRLRFQVVLSPKYSQDAIFHEIASPDLYEFTQAFPVDLTPPTDDRPFFFNTTRLTHALHSDLPNHQITRGFIDAVLILGYLLVFVIVLTFLCILVPLFLTRKKDTLKKAPPLLVYFSAIGFGFMLIEISQVQRLAIFLGHPTYSLSAVLFSLLLSCGIGSYWTSSIDGTEQQLLKRRGRLLLTLLLAALFVFGALVPRLIASLEGAETPSRIVIATIMLAFIGLFLGMAFPIGMKMASVRTPQIGPWLWGINGATSVCSSVIAVAIAMTAGISAAFWTGFGFYAVALLAFLWAGMGIPETSRSAILSVHDSI